MRRHSLAPFGGKISGGSRLAMNWKLSMKPTNVLKLVWSYFCPACCAFTAATPSGINFSYAASSAGQSCASAGCTVFFNCA